MRLLPFGQKLVIIGLDYGGQQSRLVGLQPFGMVQWGDHLKGMPAYIISKPIVFDQKKSSPLSIDVWHHIDSLLVSSPLGRCAGRQVACVAQRMGQWEPIIDHTHHPSSHPASLLYIRISDTVCVPPPPV